MFMKLLKFHDKKLAYIENNNFILNNILFNSLIIFNILQTHIDSHLLSGYSLKLQKAYIN